MRSSTTLLAVLLVIAFSGCKQKFNVIGPYKEEPVIYALLDFQQNPNYVRIQKGYLLQGNAYVAAGNIDSIYYPNILKVQLTALGTGQVYNLTRVNGNQVGLTQDTGLFANSPNYLYSLSGQLDSTQTYLLTMVDTVSNDTATAQTALASNLSIYNPQTGSTITFSSLTPSLQWAQANNAAIYDVTIRFYYYELDNTTNAITNATYIDIPLWRSIIPSSSNQFLYINVTQSDVLTFLNNNLAVNTAVKRKFRKMDFMLSAGGTDLATFLTSQQAETGLASSNILPPYTNVIGGVGLFSSRVYSAVDSVLLSSQSIDSLACSSQSGNLRFENSGGVICY